MEKIEAKHIIVKGRVQGVGFRYYTRSIGNRLGLKGVVRNLMNGDVEIYVAGEKDKLEKFIQLIKKGPPLSYVVEVKINDISPDTVEYTNFTIGF